MLVLGNLYRNILQACAFSDAQNKIPPKVGVYIAHKDGQGENTMSSKVRNRVLFVLCVIMVVSALACGGGGDGGLVQGMQDANQNLQNVAKTLTDVGVVK